jgi:hypothetical protein
VLTIGDYTQELPHLSVAGTVTVWQVPEEYIPSGYFVSVSWSGSTESIPACSSADAIFLGRLELPAHPDAELEAAKKSRLASINMACDKELAQLAETYPSGEISSWPQQVKEAEALTIDPNTATPLLSTIAVARGLTVADLAGRVLAKAAAYSEAAGQIIGKRQALEDALDIATTTEEISIIYW